MESLMEGKREHETSSSSRPSGWGRPDYSEVPKDACENHATQRHEYKTCIEVQRITLLPVKQREIDLQKGDQGT
jgi:hypothetical protein